MNDFITASMNCINKRAFTDLSTNQQQKLETFRWSMQSSIIDVTYFSCWLFENVGRQQRISKIICVKSLISINISQLFRIIISYCNCCFRLICSFSHWILIKWLKFVSNFIKQKIYNFFMIVTIFTICC